MRNLSRLPALVIVCVTALTGACGGSSSPPPPPTSATTPPPTPTPPPFTSGIRLYVSDETGGNVVVIDPAAGQVVEKIAVGKRPRGIRLSRDGKELLVALSGSPIGGPGVDESKLPPPDRTADGIGIVDLATHKLIRKYQSGEDPEVFDISPDGSTIYVSNEASGHASVVATARGTGVTRHAWTVQRRTGHGGPANSRCSYRFHSG